MITPNPRFIGDTIAFDIFIQNLSNRPGTLRLEDQRPVTWIDFVSASIAPDSSVGNPPLMVWDPLNIPTTGLHIILTGQINATAIPTQL